jgi:hypothetical protein
MNRNLKLQSLFVLLLSVLVVGSGCRVTQEEAGEAPDVDVQVDPGELPEYDVEGPEVEVGTEEAEVTVPEVEVTTEEKEVTVPDVDVTLPGQDGDDN